MVETRRRLTAGEKVGILKQHLVEGKAVSELCDQHGVNPTQFYRWQKDLFEGAEAIFQRGNGDRALEKENEMLREKIKRKDEVLCELAEDHIRLKKSLGEI
jgi:transposase-like protein